MVGISIGYAAITTTLNINGNTTIEKASWDIHFENLVKTEGSVEATTEASIDTTKTIINYTINLLEPGDFYEFTVDIVNSGSIDAKISEVLKKGLTTDQEKYIDYIATYTDGTSLQEDDVLYAGEKENIIVSVKYKQDIEPSDLPKEDVTLSLVFQVIYVQSDLGENLTAPTISSKTSTSNSITAEYTTGNAATGIKTTSCYLTDQQGEITSTGTLNGDSCEFSSLSASTTYYFKKCIISNSENESCSTIDSIETAEALTAPTLSSKSSTTSSITAVYTAGIATTGIKTTSCYRTDSTGTIISTGTLSGNNCVFSGLSKATTYYFKKCIISNSDNESCSTVGSIKTAGTAKSFAYTGGMQSYTIPCTGNYTLEVWGGQGSGTNGGKGGYSKGTVKLNKGAVVYVAVGGAGSGSKGGYNGGGTAAGAGGYGGGGATHIGTFNNTLAGRGSTSGLYIVAGGGGGQGPSYQYGSTTYTPYGGTGGGTSGGAGQTIQESAYYAIGGKGASQSAGGGSITHATGTYAGTAGSFGQGAGGSGIDQKHGGGGGGLYGGGSGGHYAGGGGGSGYIGGVSSGSMTNGSRANDGAAKITNSTCTN